MKKIYELEIVLAELESGFWRPKSKERALGLTLAPSSCTWGGRGRGVDKERGFQKDLLWFLNSFFSFWLFQEMTVKA